MGNSSASELASKDPLTPELIVAGYIREHSHSLSQPISTDIRQICLAFFYQDWHMFLTIGSAECAKTEYNAIKCLNLKSLETYEFALHDLTWPDGPCPFQSIGFDKMFFGECLQQNTSLPPWVLRHIESDDDHPLSAHHRYNILYRIAGARSMDGKLTKRSNCIIYDPLQFRKGQLIDGYYLDLPEIEVPMTSNTAVLNSPGAGLPGGDGGDVSLASLTTEGGGRSVHVGE